MGMCGYLYGDLTQDKNGNQKSFIPGPLQNHKQEIKGRRNPGTKETRTSWKKEKR
jgi:hypothetical protein